MCPDRYLLVAIVAAAMVAYVAAKPHGIKEFTVSDVANMTMCPIKEEIDDDPERIPRRIKYFKCAGGPNGMCDEHNTSALCCKHQYDAYHTECVEIYDYVVVMDVQQGQPNTRRMIRVPVGCNCLIEAITEAKDEP